MRLSSKRRSKLRRLAKQRAKRKRQQGKDVEWQDEMEFVVQRYKLQQSRQRRNRTRGG